MPPFTPAKFRDTTTPKGPLGLKAPTGSTGAPGRDALTVKQGLRRLGRLQPPAFPDGIRRLNEHPDRETVAGIRSFQKTHGLKPDGSLNPGGPTERTLAAALGKGPKAAAAKARRALPKGPVGTGIKAAQPDVDALTEALAVTGNTLSEDTQTPADRADTIRYAIQDFQRDFPGQLARDGIALPGGPTLTKLDRQLALMETGDREAQADGILLAAETGPFKETVQTGDDTFTERDNPGTVDAIASDETNGDDGTDTLHGGSGDDTVNGGGDERKPMDLPPDRDNPKTTNSDQLKTETDVAELDIDPDDDEAIGTIADKLADELGWENIRNDPMASGRAKPVYPEAFIGGAGTVGAKGAIVAGKQIHKKVLTNRLAKELSKDAPKTIEFGKVSKDLMKELQRIREVEGQPPLSSRQVQVYENVLKKLQNKRLDLDKLTPQQVAETAYRLIHKRGTIVERGTYPTSHRLTNKDGKGSAEGYVGRENQTGNISVKTVFPTSGKKNKPPKGR